MIVAGAWIWSTQVKMGSDESNMRNLISSLVLILAGAPSVLGEFGGDTLADAAADAPWLYPVHPIFGGLGAAFGLVLLWFSLMGYWNNRS